MSRMAKLIAVLVAVAGLGGAMIPLSSYASEKVQFKANVGNTIGLTIDGTHLSAGELNFGTMLNGGAPVVASVTIVVNTGNASGYSVMIRGENHDPNLYLQENGVANEGVYIPSGDMTGTNKSEWGYAVNDSATYKAVTGDAETIVSTETNIEQSTQVRFAIKASTTQPEGTYKGGVTITASANS